MHCDIAGTILSKQSISHRITACCIVSLRFSYSLSKSFADVYDYLPQARILKVFNFAMLRKYINYVLSILPEQRYALYSPSYAFVLLMHEVGKKGHSQGCDRNVSDARNTFKALLNRPGEE